ncbi:MAG: DNA polymerase III subunit gamma/tau [Candidatus Andersenbacteria bacterium]|nr:DNA polymerase III subunit gamma/tau [Candidatus Andersenbacteria bacterium]MBI3250351.1 DNA polymerase III subunit gamma/tau [Candidatus Andersenbacteria bacterium]
MSLYRTYRPKTFGEVVGQPHVVGALQSAISSNRVSHAYLFQGPRGTGKTTVARLLAKAVGASGLDITEIDAASNRGIDDVRALRESVLTSPTGGKYKVYIIDEVHMLTGEAFAALLKTLEEPVAHAIFILATTELHKVPDTIKSRCQVFRFRRASADEMRGRLSHILKAEKQKVGDDILSFIISRSDGCYRDAESLLGQILTLKTETDSLGEMMELLGMPSPELVSNFLSTLISGDAAGALETAQTAYERGYDPELFIEESIRTARDRAITETKAGGTSKNLPLIIRNLVQAKQDLAYVPQPLIALQLAILNSVPIRGNNLPTAPVATSKMNTPPIKTAPIKKVTPVKEKAAPIVSTSVIALEQIQSAWPSVIEAMKPKSPAASTFLRAMEAQSISGSTLVIAAQYALHRNFFEKPDNKQLLTTILSDQLKADLEVRIALESSGKAPATNGRAQAEAQLLQNVQEIFR